MKTTSSIRYDAAATYRRLPKVTTALPFVFATALGASLWAATAKADPLIVGNNDGPQNFGFDGSIQTYDFGIGGAPVASFVPTGATTDDNRGFGVAVVGNKVYYTEIPPSLGSTDFIRIAPFNGGAGGADIAMLPNPRFGTGVQALAVANGVLYALTGFPGAPPPQVFGLNPLNGDVVSGPVTISGPAPQDAEGFTVLPNGNFLINSGQNSCTYNQYNSTTGVLIPATTITLRSFSFCKGVATNGVHLFFQTEFNSFTETDLTGFVISTNSVSENRVVDISLITFGASGVPGKPSCHGRTVSDLANQYGGIYNAAADLGYSSVAALKSAIDRFCDTP